MLSLETAFATAVRLRRLQLALLHAPRDRSSPSDMPSQRPHDVLYRTTETIAYVLSSTAGHRTSMHREIACLVVPAGIGRLV